MRFAWLASCLVACGGAPALPLDAAAGVDGPASVDGPDGASGLAIEPPAIRMPAGRSQIFVASDATAAWSIVEPGGGTIDATGAYVAPDLPGTYHVTATTGAGTTMATVTVEQMYLALVTGRVAGVGNNDGIGDEAAFMGPRGTAYDGAGTLFVADENLIRAVDIASGAVTTLAGGGMSVDRDGVGEAARFDDAEGLAYDATTRTLYVSDAMENAVRAIDVPTRTVTTVAGALGAGYVDGPGATAQFQHLRGICLAGKTLYIVELDASTIRTVDTASATHEVATVAGQPQVHGFDDAANPALASFYYPHDVACTPTTIYVADFANSAIRTIDRASGAVGTLVGSPAAAYGDGDFATAGIDRPYAITVANGVLYLGDQGHGVIRALDLNAHTVTTLAGDPSAIGLRDGAGTNALMQKAPAGFAVVGSTLWFSDRLNSDVRTLDLGSKRVTTIAGSPYLPTVGSADGDLAHATFTGPWPLASDPSTGDILVGGNDTIRTVSLAAGQVTTRAGQAGVLGSADGAPGIARLSGTWGLAIDPHGTVWEAEYSGAIREVGADGSVTTRFGWPLQSGSVDAVGTAARFDVPAHIAWVGGRLIIADSNNATIRSADVATGMVTTIAGAPAIHGHVDGIGGAARFEHPYSLASDGVSKVWIGDWGDLGFTIRELDLATGAVTTIAGSTALRAADDGVGPAAHFCVGYALAYDGAHSLYVADTSSDRWGPIALIRRIWLPSHAVSTYAGQHRRFGAHLGPLQTATLAYPDALAFTSSGVLLTSGSNGIFAIVAE